MTVFLMALVSVGRFAEADELRDMAAKTLAFHRGGAIRSRHFRERFYTRIARPEATKPKM
jgi:hypothetical protein